MSSSIREFWRRLEGTVHPDDAPFFASSPHTFNLDFPPPAFIGDVDKAPVVILKLHGGYNPIETRSEFPTQADADQYRDWLKGVRDQPPRNLSSYYKSDPLYDLIKRGELVIVNAIAYRVATPSVADKSLAEFLPSVRAHRGWLQSELIPAAKGGARLAIFHQWSLWKIDKPWLAGGRILFDSPRTKYVSKAAQATIRDSLRRGSLRG